jgi:hypothetical protein
MGAIPNIVLYLALIVIVSISLMFPAPFVTVIHKNNQACYDYMQAKFPDNGVALLEIGNDFAYSTSHLPGVVALFTHMIAVHHGKVVMYTLFEDGVLSINRLYLPAFIASGAFKDFKYGTDYAVLGFVPGGETATAAVAQNIKLLGRDIYGNDLNQLPITKNLTDANSLSLWVHAGYRYLFPIRQVAPKYKVPLIIVEHPGAIQYLPVYMDAGTITCFINGWPGASEYESLLLKVGLLHYTGLGTLGGLAVTTGYFVVLAYAVVGNVSWFGQKLLKRGVKGSKEAK